MTLRRGLRLSTLWRGLPRLRGEIHLPKLDCDYDRDILTPVVQHLRLRNPGVLLVTADRQHVAHSRGRSLVRSIVRRSSLVAELLYSQLFLLTTLLTPSPTISSQPFTVTSLYPFTVEHKCYTLNTQRISTTLLLICPLLHFPTLPKYLLSLSLTNSIVINLY